MLVRIIALFLVFATLLSACNVDDGLTFEECQNISDRFIKTFPEFGGCSVNEKDFLHYLEAINTSYVLHNNEDSSVSHLITNQTEDYVLDKNLISRIYIVYGPLTKYPERKEDYAVFVSANGDILSILPRYAYFGF